MHEAEHEVVNLHVAEGVYVLIDPDFIGGFQINRRGVVAHEGHGADASAVAFLDQLHRLLGVPSLGDHDHQ